MNLIEPFNGEMLECLAALAEEGNFERAAQRHNITQSAVSQRLITLESQIGTALVIRSRPLKLTPAGQILLKHAKQLRILKADVSEAMRALGNASSRRYFNEERISIAIDPDWLESWILPALKSFALDKYSLEILHENHDVTPKLLHEGMVQGCVSSQSKTLPGCRTVYLGDIEYFAVAETKYANEVFPGGLGIANFRHGMYLAKNCNDSIPSNMVSSFLELPQVRLNQNYIPSLEGRLQAVLDGWGVGVFQRHMVDTHISEGRLCNVIEKKKYVMPLYWHCHALESNVLDKLTSVLLENFVC